MMQELHKCSKTMDKTKKDIEYFSVVQGVQAKVMLYILYKETCHIFSKTQ